MDKLLQQMKEEWERMTPEQKKKWEADEEERLKEWADFLEKTKDITPTPEEMAYIYWMDDVEAGIFRTQEEKKARLELFRKQYVAGKPMKAQTPDEFYDSPEGIEYRKRREKEAKEWLKKFFEESD